MERFKSRRDFINKSITLSFGIGFTQISILDEIMKSQHPTNQIQSSELKNLIENSPLLATGGKFDSPKEGCCAWDGMDGMKCIDKK